MEFSTLNDKLLDPSGKIDLLSNIISIDYANVIVKDVIRIDDSTEMSLDLISKVMYGAEDHTDILAKFNRLSNPLELTTGMIIAIPDLISYERHSTKINYSPQKLQKQKILFSSEIETTQSTPTKTNKSRKTTHYRKDSNGNIVF